MPLNYVWRFLFFLIYSMLKISLKLSNTISPGLRQWIFATSLSWGYFIVFVGVFWQKQEQQGGDAAPEEDSSQCSSSPEWRGHQQHVRGRLGGGPRWRRLRVPAFYTHQTVHRVWREHTHPRGMKSQSVWKKCSKIYNANIPNQKTSQRKLQRWYVKHEVN